MKRCKVCKSASNVNASGRCRLCQTAKDALEAGISYGEFVSRRVNTRKLSTDEVSLTDLKKTKKCRWCGAEFVVGNRNKAYCSDECRKAQNDVWNRERKARGATPPLCERACVICGSIFMPKVTQQITCSSECSLARRREMARDLRMKARESQKCQRKTMD